MGKFRHKSEDNTNTQRMIEWKRGQATIKARFLSNFEFRVPIVLCLRLETL